MKIKTSELDGAELDYAVAKCEGQEVEFEDGELHLPSSYFKDGDPYKPSENWAQGGPIIEREWISITNSNDKWMAEIATDCADGYLSVIGPTPLIAAMRCYVASKLGEEVEIPEEVCNE